MSSSQINVYSNPQARPSRLTIFVKNETQLIWIVHHIADLFTRDVVKIERFDVRRGERTVTLDLRGSTPKGVKKFYKTYLEPNAKGATFEIEFTEETLGT